MNIPLANREQVLIDEIRSEKKALSDLHERLQTVDSELVGLAPQREQFQLLGVICESLDQLKEMGAASLFWGDELSIDGHEQRIAHSRELADIFHQQLAVLEESRGELVYQISDRQEVLGELQYDLDEIREEAAEAEYDFVIEREARDERLFRAGILPWSTPEEDRQRQHKVLRVALVVMLLIGVVPAVWKLPPPDPDKKVEIPERLAKVVKQKAAPKPVEPKPKKVEEEKKKDPAKDAPKVAEKPKPEEIKKAREKVKSKGVLAHRDMFADLTDDADLSNLGANARISGVKASGGAASNGAKGSRALITATASASGGSAAVAAVSRGGVGSGNGSAIAGNGLSVGTVASSVADAVGEARAVSDGVGPARTDEEIQIVFDRYKSALYRIYNRELRSNPTLRGKMVLELIIEPDGSVSGCRVESTDMDSPALSAKIVARVKSFNFGAKEGVPTTKILYPIDFLPAG